jgi:hypothetical protein
MVARLCNTYTYTCSVVEHSVGHQAESGLSQSIPYVTGIVASFGPTKPK